MLLWRLAGVDYAQVFDGGYGLRFNGRWNTIGHPVTYCATSPALCVLEKLVHIEDPSLLPDLVMIQYEGPDDLGMDIVAIEDLPDGWQRQEGMTQGLGDRWHEARPSPLLKVPSALLPLAQSPDRTIVINHTHPDTR